MVCHELSPCSFLRTSQRLSLALISPLLSLPENKNSSQRMKALLNGQSSDRKLIETYLLSPYVEVPLCKAFRVCSGESDKRALGRDGLQS
jgi:hypothetical protein